MIKNVKIKMLLTNTVFRGLSIINQLIPKDDNIVLLYSNMGFRDNISYLYEYMIENNYNSKYKIVRSQNEKFAGKAPENVRIISNVSAIGYYFRAGHVFYCFGKLPIYPSKNQKVVQMWHGSPFKGGDIREKAEANSSNVKSYYTNVLSASPIFAQRWMEEFNCSKEQISICGHPRTDVMKHPYSKEEMGIIENKMILWMPTFRKSKQLGYNDVEKSNSLVPVLKNDDFVMLNSFLKDKECRLIIKLHPMQDIDTYKKLNLSNIELLTHELFTSRGYDLYRLIATADALITDYSSVFYDFMLMHRPIAFTEDDYEDYKDSRGFSVENPDYFRAGHKIKLLSDLEVFVKDVCDENDTWNEKREEVNRVSNYYQDFNNSKRALQIGGVVLKEN